MNHADHVRLLRDGVVNGGRESVDAPAPGGVWADLGSGTGAFTLALAELIGPGGQIYSVDKDRGALREQERALRARFPEVVLHPVVADFTRPLELPPLDGLVMANALHFVPHQDKQAVVQRLRLALRPGGVWLLVEYNVDRGNFAVPHPLSYATWAELARRAGFARTRLLAAVPSRFLGEIYSAASG